MIFVSRLLHYGKSPISGTVYTKEELQKMVDKWESTKDSSPIFGTLDAVPDSVSSSSFTIDLESIASEVVQMELDEEGLVVYQKLLDTPQGNKLIDAINIENEFPEEIGATLTSHPITVGNRDDTGFAYNMRLLSIKFSMRVNK